MPQLAIKREAALEEEEAEEAEVLELVLPLALLALVVELPDVVVTDESLTRLN